MDPSGIGSKACPAEMVFLSTQANLTIKTAGIFTHPITSKVKTH